MEKNKYLEKIAHLFSHSTSDENLDRMLASGSIKSVRHLAIENPDLKISVETSLPFMRRDLPAMQALDEMSAKKNPDKIFLAMASYIPNYGNNVIVKHLTHPVGRSSLNTIPNEYTTRRKLSLKHNASIYVPDERIQEYKDKYPGFNFLPKSSIDIPSIGLKERALNYPDKVLDFFNLKKEASIDPKSISRNAILGGSVGLGINTDLSDTDIFIPYKRKNHYENAILRIKARHPELQERSTTINKDHKTSLTGVINGKEIDVVFGLGDKALTYADRYKFLKSSLTEEEKRRIIDKKRSLKSSWILPNLRYKIYKNELAQELGLKELYF